MPLISIGIDRALFSTGAYRMVVTSRRRPSPVSFPAQKNVSIGLLARRSRVAFLPRGRDPIDLLARRGLLSSCCARGPFFEARFRFRSLSPHLAALQNFATRAPATARHLACSCATRRCGAPLAFCWPLRRTLPPGSPAPRRELPGPRGQVTQPLYFRLSCVTWPRSPGRLRGRQKTVDYVLALVHVI